MALNDRLQLIRELENLRGSRVIAYVTSDRLPPFQAQMAMDVVRRFYNHLSGFRACEKIDVFLFSTGGDWPYRRRVGREIVLPQLHN